MENRVNLGYLHQLCFIAIALSFLGFSLVVYSSHNYTMTIALFVTVLLIGIPHGAADPLLARKAGLCNNKRGLLFFSLVYFLVAISAFFAWLIAPLVSLSVFLLISAWHFSSDWLSDYGRRYAFSISVALLSLPAILHSSELERLFETLTYRDVTGLIVTLKVTAILGTIIGVIGVLHSMATTRVSKAEVVVLMLSALILPPLLFFMLYFCFLHSPRHLLRLNNAFKKTGFGLLNTILIFSCLTILLAALLIIYSPAISLETAVIRTTFIGLFALTIPHMILNEFIIEKKLNGS